MPFELHWFPLYPADFLTDEKFIQLEDHQQAWYFKLICYQWINGSIPADVKSVLAMLKPSTSPADGELELVLDLCFVAGKVKKTLVNAKLEKIRQEQIKLREARSLGGKVRAQNLRNKRLMNGDIEEAQLVDSTSTEDGQQADS